MPQRVITSLHDPRVKQAARLRERRERDRQGHMLIDGAREIFVALRAGVSLREVYVCEELCTSERTRELLEELARRSIAPWHVSADVLERLAYGQRAEGVVAVAGTPPARFEALEVPAGSLVAVVEGVEKPGNLGAVLRSADAAGVSAVIATGAGADLFNPNCIRASLGTVFSLPVATAGPAEALAWLRTRGFRIFAATPNAERLYTQADFHGAAAIVLGSESGGLSPDWQSANITPIKLPMLGLADSLNVSAAAAVLFYEALRQRSA